MESIKEPFNRYLPDPGIRNIKPFSTRATSEGLTLTREPASNPVPHTSIEAVMGGKF
jgi:hypothetical protein